MKQAAKLGAAFLAGTLIAGGGAIAATSADNEIVACVNAKTRVLTLVKDNGKCPTGTTRLAWNIQGPQGPAGTVTNASNGTSAVPAGALNATAVAKTLLPSVVSIEVVTTAGSGSGTGFIYRSDASTSYVVTNNHVVEGARTVTVELEDGTEYTGTVVGTDADVDIAVVKLSKGNLPVATLGDSADVVIGQPVVAIGSPLGLSGTVTTGIVSALNRPVTTGSTNNADAYINAIQTDAAINPGNSGGPLADASGAVIGINSAIATLGSSYGTQSGSIGLGFAIPMNQAKRVANELIATGASTRPVLGVYFDQAFTGTGARISRLVSDGAAEKAGIPSGSVIRAIGGRNVKDMLTAVVTIRSYAPGASVKITVELPNNAGSKTFTVTLGSASSN